ncbi:MAG: hypothetical protein HZA93_03865 [Verrucomicrobia bacterium]|nr:hypothetical protein [Verrucomicrobiota bacterium]
MSTQATLFTLYLIVGLLLMSVAMAAGQKRKRAMALDPLIDGTAPGAGLLFFIALLWPIWLVVSFTKKKSGGSDSARR